MGRHAVILVTAGSAEEAGVIASKLLEAKKAACVNIVDGVKSVFWWKGRTEEEDEVLLVIKSSMELLEAIEDIVKQHHSYEVPEIIALPVSGGNRDYLDWIDSCLSM